MGGAVVPRLYRQAPLNGIWERSGNIQFLDALRAVRTHPDSLDALSDELATTTGHHPALDAATGEALDSLATADDLTARRAVEAAALALQASLLVRHGRPAVADAFIASRVSVRHHGAIGTLPPDVDLTALVDRTPAGSG